MSMTPNIKIISTAAALIFATAACTDEIDFDYNSIDSLPVIEAYVNPTGAKVTLTNTRDMSDSTHTHTISGASVSLLCPDGRTVSLAETTAGEYTSADIEPQAGDVFSIKVTTDGTTYEATDTMAIAPENLTAYFAREEIMEKDRITFRFSFTAPTDSLTCYVALLTRNGKTYKCGTRNNYAHYDDGTVEGRMTCFNVDDIDDEDKQDKVLHDGDIMQFSLAGISRRAYDYLSALDYSGTTNANPSWQFAGGQALGLFSAQNVVTFPAITFKMEEVK